MTVQRFTLDQSQLNDTAYGLGGASPAFILNEAALNQGVLDGTNFLTVGTATASLGGASVTAQGDVTVVVQSIGVAELGAATATASALVAHTATATATASATATAATTVTHLAVGNAALGSLTASSTAAVALTATASSEFGALTANAAGTVTHIASGITSVSPTATATATVESINAGFAPLGELAATAIATVTPVTKSAGGGGIRWIQPQQRPTLPQIKQLEPQPEPIKVRPVIKPAPKPIRLVSASAISDAGELSALAVSRIDWIAELDDIEVLELI